MPLYCETHRVLVTDRGGQAILGQLENLVDVQWERVRDGISEASVTVSQPSPGCVELLAKIAANRHEIVIYRGDQRVWEGPVTHIGRHAGSFQITARDVMHYLHRTVCHNEYDSAAYWSPDEKDPNKVFIDNTEPVVDRAVRMIRAELLRTKEDPAQVNPVVNVEPFLTPLRATNIDDEREVNRRTLAYMTTVHDDLESLAQYGGLDYTVVGRRIILNDTRLIIGKTAPVTEQDFLSEVVITTYGMDSFTRAYTTGDNGMYGVAGGVDDFYGEWENLEQMFNEDSTEAPSQKSLDNAAAYNMLGRLPVPTIVRIPDNSQINPNGTLSVQDLVPGVIIPVRATLTAITLIQDQKLSSVKVTESGEGGEAISITLAEPPASYIE